MKRHSPFPFRCIGVLTLILCLLLPAQAQALFGSVTVADEIEMGRKFDETIRQQMSFVDDPEIVFYVNSVVARVAATLPPQPYPIRSAVVGNNAMNAFAIPGGYIYIFTGLILGVENEAELAAVISHELGHVTQHHVARRMEQMKYINIASFTGLIAGVLLGGAGGGGSTNSLGKALSVGAMAGGQSAFLMYTRENEREADNVGLNYLVKAGYNPNAMPATFEIMNRQRWFMSGDSIPSYLSTHPGLDERIDYLRDRIRHLPADVVARDYQKDKFLRIQTILRARMSSAETALAYYDSKKGKLTCLDIAGRGIALDRLKRQQPATQAFNEALACGPDDPLVLREAGMFFFNQGNMNKAAPLLQKAAFLNPKDAMSMFFTARIMAERKDYTGAIALMERVKQQVPEDAEVRFHLGRMLGESGNIFAAHLELSYSFHYGHDKQKAMFHMDKAKSLASSPEQKKQLEDLQRTLGMGKGGPGGKDGKDGGKGNDPGGSGGKSPLFEMRFGRG
jgi:predicted Zn-dependent protease